MKNLVKMSVSKIFIILFFIASYSFSQNKKEDVYFILKDNSDCIIEVGGVKINKVKNFHKIEKFNLYDKVEYEEREKKIAKEKKENTYYPTSYWEVSNSTLFFEVVSKTKETITHCDISFFKLVDYKWLQKNSWVENNPNVLFKDLYFLLKTKGNKYLKYKVKRVLVEY